MFWKIKILKKKRIKNNYLDKRKIRKKIYKCNLNNKKKENWFVWTINFFNKFIIQTINLE
jgi:hypothetical protein